jgi:hypothetical protein
VALVAGWLGCGTGPKVWRKNETGNSPNGVWRCGKEGWVRSSSFSFLVYSGIVVAVVAVVVQSSSR